MERYFVFDNFNTYYDWNSILTSKTIDPPEAKTKYVDIDGMSGSLDLTESLAGEVTYKDRSVSASFWTNTGNRAERENLMCEIISQLHGKKIKIVEPDDPDHYFYGRAKVSIKKNIIPYSEFSIDCTCEPWRYAIEETVRRLDIDSQVVTNMIFHNKGVKTLCPDIIVDGYVDIIYDGVKTSLTAGSYRITDLKLRQGSNIVGVSGIGSVTFKYREATL